MVLKWDFFPSTLSVKCKFPIFVNQKEKKKELRDSSESANTALLTLARGSQSALTFSH